MIQVDKSKVKIEGQWAQIMAELTVLVYTIQEQTDNTFDVLDELRLKIAIYKELCDDEEG